MLRPKRIEIIQKTAKLKQPYRNHSLDPHNWTADEPVPKCKRRKRKLIGGR